MNRIPRYCALAWKIPLTLLIASAGCGDGEEDPRGDFNGTWDLRLAVSGEDQCGLVAPGLTSFQDRQEITQDNGSIELSSRGGFIQGAEGSLTGAEAFTAEELSEREVFGDGIICQVSILITYTSTTADTADVTISEQLLCEDGFECESRAVGTAVIVEG